MISVAQFMHRFFYRYLLKVMLPNLSAIMTAYGMIIVVATHLIRLDQSVLFLLSCYLTAKSYFRYDVFFRQYSYGFPIFQFSGLE